jgi:hypothetical protein
VTADLSGGFVIAWYVNTPMGEGMPGRREQATHGAALSAHDCGFAPRRRLPLTDNRRGSIATRVDRSSNTSKSGRCARLWSSTE